MASKVRIGLVGAGMIGDVHVANVAADGRGEVTRVATASRATLDAKLPRYGITQGSLDYRDVVRDPEIDAVIVASPPHTHAPIILAALEAGKHVLLEKPMATTREDVARIVEGAAAHPQQIVLDCSCRHARLQPKFRAVKRMIEDGRLGEVYHIHHSHLTRGTFIEYNPAGRWALDKAKAGGGPLIDWGVYDLSFHLGLLDDRPQLSDLDAFTRGGLKVFKDGVRQDVEEHGAAFMRFDGGLTYYYERGSGAHCETSNETRIMGTKGSLRFGFCSWDPPSLEYFGVGADGSETRELLPVDMSEHTEDNLELTKHFLDCLLGTARPMMPVALAARHLEILFRVLPPSL